MSDERPSKSAIKREMHALQALAQKMLELSPKQLDKIPMSERMRKGVDDCIGFKKEARRRQLQFLGKVMRDEDREGIEAALNRFEQGSREEAAELHALERWRDRLVADDAALTEYLAQHRVDAQNLRTLIRNARAEKAGAGRALFRFLKAQD